MSKILCYRTVVTLCLLFLAVKGNGQATVQMDNVQVTFNKTSSIVFPAIISSVDRGSPDVLARKAKGVDNVLQLKAATRNFEETNLTVITADGNLHHFLVRYSDRPLTFTYQAAQSATANGRRPGYPLIFQPGMTVPLMQRYCQAIIDKGKEKNIRSTASYDIKLALRGIFIHDDVMFFHLKISNRSNIPYHTDILRLYVKDRQKVSRTASQEVEKIPLYRLGNDQVIKGRSVADVVYAIPKFTIPDSRLLVFEAIEKDGGRNLRLSVRNRAIMKARPVALRF